MKIIFFIFLALYVLNLIISAKTKNRLSNNGSDSISTDLLLAFILWVLEYNNIPNPFNIGYVRLYLTWICISIIIVVLSFYIKKK